MSSAFHSAATYQPPISLTALHNAFRLADEMALCGPSPNARAGAHARRSQRYRTVGVYGKHVVTAFEGSDMTARMWRFDIGKHVRTRKGGNVLDKHVQLGMGSDRHLRRFDRRVLAGVVGVVGVCVDAHGGVRAGTCALEYS
eukprot:4982370-Pleurochrysis_carterae.AAC.2